MTRYFVNPKERCAFCVWTEIEDLMSDAFVQYAIANGYVECGWWRYQYYKGWKAR